MRMLLIEDDVMFGKALVRGLTDQGMTIDWVQNEDEGVVALERSVALTAGLIFRHGIQPCIDTEFEDQLDVQIRRRSEQSLHPSGSPVEAPTGTNWAILM